MCAKMPKYAELYTQLRHAILSGEYPAGTFLPTENELMKIYDVSKTTIRHAVKMLRDHDLVEVKQGSGTKVLSMEQKMVTGSKYNNPGSSTSISVRYTTQGKGEINNTKAVIDVIPAPEHVAKALNLAGNEQVYRLQRLQLVDTVTFGYMVNYIPKSLAPDLGTKGELLTDLYGHLFRNYGIQVEEANETVDAMVAGFMEAQYLQVEISTPLILLKRIASGNGQLIEYCETIVRPDLFHMTIHVDTPGHETAVFQTE